MKVTLLCFARADFTVADDISAIAPIVISIANRFAEYDDPQCSRQLLVVV